MPSKKKNTPAISAHPELGIEIVGGRVSTLYGKSSLIERLYTPRARDQITQTLREAGFSGITITHHRDVEVVGMAEIDIRVLGNQPVPEQLLIDWAKEQKEHRPTATAA